MCNKDKVKNKHFRVLLKKIKSGHKILCDYFEIE